MERRRRIGFRLPPGFGVFNAAIALGAFVILSVELLVCVVVLAWHFLAKIW